MRGSPSFRLRVGRTVELFRDRVFRLAYAVVLDHDMAQDVTQDVLLKIVRDFDLVTGLSNPDAWIRAVTVHAALNAKCRTRRHQVLDEAFVSVPDESDRVAVRRVMEGLSKDLRAVIALCDLEGLTYAEAAAILGVPEGTVASRLSAARAEFRDRWGKPGG